MLQRCIDSSSTPAHRNHCVASDYSVLTARCFRSCAALAAKAVEVADMLVVDGIAQGGIGVIAPEVDQLLQVKQG